MRLNRIEWNGIKLSRMTRYVSSVKIEKKIETPLNAWQKHIRDVHYIRYMCGCSHTVIAVELKIIN